MSEPEAVSTFRRWSDVVGHESTLAALGHAIAQGRLHHANLFIGPDGIGKRQIAYALATALHCEEPTNAGGCGDCSSCLLHQRGEHPDFVSLKPEGRYIKIDAIRELQKATRFRPYSAAVRIVVIDQAESMRDEAANALLKTLEEPSGDTVFVLLAAQANRLLPTIRSRCQPVRCAPLTTAETLAVLSRLDGNPGETAARLSYGSPGRALDLAASGVLDSREALVDELLSLRQRDASLPSRIAEAWANDRAGTDARFEALLWIVRDLLFATLGEEERIANRDLLVPIEEGATRLGADRVSTMWSLIIAARQQFLGNVNLRMVFETMLIDVQTLMLEESPA